MAGALQLALVLNAYNNMQAAIRSAQSQVRGLGNTVNEVARATKRQDWLSGLINQVDQAKRKVRELQGFGGSGGHAGRGGYGGGLGYTTQLSMQGMEQTAAGLVLIAPVQAAVEAAGNFEYAMKKVEIASYDATIPLKERSLIMKQLTDQAHRLGQATAFSDVEAAKTQTELIRAGMGYRDVLNGGADAAMYLAQAAEMAPEAAAGAIAKVSNMFNLNGSMLKQTADDINRAAQASSADVQDLMYSLQLSGMSANTLGLKAKETTLLLATLYNKGLGNLAGSSLNNMLLRLDEISPQARKALNQLGLIEGMKFKQTKGGKLKIVDPGQSTLFNAKGEIKNAEALVQSLRQMFYKNKLDLSQLVDAKGNLLPQEQINKLFGAKKMNEMLGLLKQAFGEEGMRAAIALAATGKGSYEETVKAAQRAMALEKQIQEMQQTAVGLFEQMKGTWETFKSSGGSPVLDELKALITSGIQALGWLNNWTKAHPEATRWILRIVAGLGLFTLTVGASKMALSAVLGSLLSVGGPFLDIAKFALKSGNSLRGFYNTFRYFRQGAGIFRSLWAAISFGSPLLTRLGNIAWRFGGRLAWLGVQALWMGARMALAWLIGLGPVGWIILGVTAAIAAGVAAWKTNFLGFKDKVLEIWNKVKEVFNKIKEFFGFKGTATIQVKTSDNLGSVPKPSITPPIVPNVPKTVNSAVQDNRQYNFNIKSTDPKAAAREVTRVTGGNDKYVASRDPRLQPALSY